MVDPDFIRIQYLVLFPMIGHLLAGPKGVPAVWAEVGLTRAIVTILMVAQIPLAHKSFGAVNMAARVAALRQSSRGSRVYRGATNS